MRKDSARSWLVIVMIGIALTISQLHRMLLSIAAPTMLSMQHLSGTSLGLLLSAFVWTYTACQMPSGWLVDRFGPKRVLAAAFLFWSLACAMTGLAASFPALIACRLVLGIAESPLFPVAHATMAQIFTEKHRGLATAIYTKGTSLGPALGSLIGSWLLIKYGWSMMFIGVGLVSLIFLLPWLSFTPNILDQRLEQRAPMKWADAVHLLRYRAIWAVSLGYFGFLYVYYVYVTWLPTYLVKARGLTTAEVAWMASIPFLIPLVAGPLSGFIADVLVARNWSSTFVRKTSIGIGLALSAMIVPAVYVQGSTAAALFMIAMAGQAIAAPAMLALPSAIAPEGRAGFVGAFQQMLGSLGGIVSPILTGVLYDRTHDFKAAVGCAGAMLLFAAIAFIGVLPGVKPVARDEPAQGDASAAGLIREPTSAAQS